MCRREVEDDVVGVNPVTGVMADGDTAYSQPRWGANLINFVGNITDMLPK